MNIDHMGALICRGVGLLLVLLGGSVFLSSLLFGPRTGWTYYAPVGRDQLTWLESLLLMVRTSFPAIIQLLAGVVLLVFGRPLGHLLALGLSGPAA